SVQSLGTVHLGQHLIDYTISDTGGIMTTLWRDRVEFVKEQHTWLCATCTFKEITDGLLRCTDIFVEDLRTLDGDEVEAAFTCDGTGKEGFTTTSVTIEEQPRTETERARRKDGGVFGRPFERFKENF